jgi:2-keto-3-deoxy-L-rhamnonate aldolase RhmA
VRTNSLLTTLREGGVAVASFLTVPDLFVAEVMGAAGMDALVVDTEHSAMSISQLHGVLAALYPSPSTLLVRVPANDDTAIKQVLDLGAEGVLVPDVRTGADGEAAVRSSRYPPEGARGFGPRRASRLHGDRVDYLRRANDEIAVIAMLESAEAVENAEAIVKVPGLSGVFIGMGDLAVSLGHLHDMGHPDVDAAAVRIARAATGQGLPFGVFTATEAAAGRWIERGAQLVTLGSDLQYIDAGIAQARASRQKLAGTAPGRPTTDR